MLSLALLAALAGSGPARGDNLVLCGTVVTDSIKCGTDMVTDGTRCGWDTVTDGTKCGTDTVTDGTKCGWDTFTDGVKCGTDTVTDGTRCGWDTVTDGAKCGWDTFTDALKCVGDANFWRTGKCNIAKRCQVARQCQVAKSCQIARQCQVAKSCQIARQCGVPRTCKSVVPCGAPTRAVDIIRHAEPGGENTCHPPADTTTTAGCCGAPGIHGCIAQTVVDLSQGGACTGPTGNALRMTPYAAPPIPICDLPPPSCGPGVSQALTSSGDTFYTTSDLHFFRGWVLEDQVAHVQVINDFAVSRRGWQPYFRLPTTADDVIAAPRAIMVNGDVTLDSSSGNLGSYRLLWEMGRHSESIRFPVFFGLGNHDVSTQVPDALSAKRMFDYLTDDMGCPGVAMDVTLTAGTQLDVLAGLRDKRSGSGNYSWDFGAVHHVQMNVWAGDQSSPYKHTADGLAWLANDLAQRVGKSGRPVVLHQHFDLSELDQKPSQRMWSPDDFNREWAVIRDYNVIGMFVGHSHEANVVVKDGLTDSAGRPRRLETFVSSTGGYNKSGGFIVARVSDHYLDVGHVEWHRQANGAITPDTLHAEKRDDGSFRYYYYGDPSATSCRKRIGDRFDPVDGVRLQQSGSGTTRTVRLAYSGAALAGPVAVRVAKLKNEVGLTNRSFVDGCAWSNADPPSAYLLLSDAQLGSLNQRQSVSVVLTFAADPGTQTIDLVKLTSIAQPATAPGTALSLSGRYVLKNGSDGSDKCLIFGGNGTSASPSRFDWGAGNEFCGFPGGKAALLANRQAVWSLQWLEGDSYLLKSAADGSDKCLIFSGNGTSANPTRYNWGAGAEFCGMPGGKAALLANRQAVWHLTALGGGAYTLRNDSDGLDKCLIFSGNGTSANPTRYNWNAGSDFCGFPGGKAALLTNKQAIWTLVPLDG